MLGFFANSRERARLRGLRRRALSEGDPARLVDAAKGFLALGDAEEAFTTAQEGLRRFPASEALARVLRFAAHERAPAALQRAREAVASRPSPEAYLDLARARLALGEEDAALELLAEAGERFPAAGRPWLEMAGIHERRFYDDHAVADGRAAINAYERAARCQPIDPRALFSLGVLYYRVGAILECRETLRKAVEIDPQDLEAGQLFRRVCAESCHPGDLDVLLRDVEETGALARTYPPGFRAAQTSLPEVLTAALEELESPDEIDQVFLLETGGKRHGATGRFADLIVGLVQAASVASLRMELGALTACVVEGQQRQVVVRRVPGAHLAVLSAPGVSATKAGMVVRRFLEKTVPPAWRTRS